MRTRTAFEKYAFFDCGPNMDLVPSPHLGTLLKLPRLVFFLANNPMHSRFYWRI